MIWSDKFEQYLLKNHPALYFFLFPAVGIFLFGVLQIVLPPLSIVLAYIVVSSFFYISLAIILSVVFIGIKNRKQIQQEK